VLVVDDNTDACHMLQAALGQAGHTVAVASTGPDAIRVASEFRPEVAVLDIGLPGMDGYELARRLRAEHPGIRLIALTGYSQVADVEAAVHAGFDAHCAKPVTTTALLSCIDPPSIL
jgi:CheY-like chemotaxis protein